MSFGSGGKLDGGSRLVQASGVLGGTVRREGRVVRGASNARGEQSEALGIANGERSDP